MAESPKIYAGIDVHEEQHGEAGELLVKMAAPLRWSTKEKSLQQIGGRLDKEVKFAC